MAASAWPHARTDRLRFVAAFVLAGVYALPLLWPPAPIAPFDPTPAHSLLERAFPGVPPVWTGLRLLALAAAAWLLGSAGPAEAVPWPRAGTRAFLPADPRPVARALRGAALVVAVVHVLAAFGREHLGIPGQTLFMFALAAPAALLALARRLDGAPRSPAPPWGLKAWPLVATATVIVVWSVMRLALGWGSPRALDAADAWRTLGSHFEFVRAGGNFLFDPLDRNIPGQAAIPLFFHGLPLFVARRMDPSFAWLQFVHVLWLAIAAAGTARVARALVGDDAVPVVVAVLLFCPFVLFLPLNAMVLGLGLTVVALACVALLGVHRDRSEVALAALGPLVGLVVPYPNVTGAACLVGLGALLSLARAKDFPVLAFSVSACSFAAIVIPAIPDFAAMGAMVDEFVGLHGRFSSIESAVFGQVSPAAVALDGPVWDPAGRSLLAPALGALLSPFAAPRTPIRLWGDSIYDPVGPVLAAVGLVLCFRSLRRGPGALSLLALAAVAIVPGCITSYDRPSLTRAIIQPIPVALLAGLGFRHLSALLLDDRRRRTVALTTTVIVALGGSVLFDIVNPRILRGSGQALMMQAVDADSAAQAAIVTYPLTAHGNDVHWLWVDAIAGHSLPYQVAVVKYEGPLDLEEGLGSDRPFRSVFLWMPGFEQDHGLTATLCRRWPRTRIFTVVDRVGQSRAFAAAVDGSDWHPALAEQRWTSSTCEALDSPTDRAAG